MPIKKYKPTSPGRRNTSVNAYTELTTDTPYKPLTSALKSKAGRGSGGRISIRSRGGGHKRRYRHLSFTYDKIDVPATVLTIEYDPNRTAFIALVEYKDGEKRYLLAHKDMQVGDTVITSNSAKPVPGNSMQMGNIPTGIQVHNVELIVGQGAKAIRSAGTYGTVSSQDGEYTQIKLSSGEVRYFHKNCYATIGIVSNIDHGLVVIGKAGRSRWKGRRPHVLGKSMNPVDHPHGGGEGHVSLGGQPKTPWGKPALGVKTRKNKRTNKWIATDKR